MALIHGLHLRNLRNDLLGGVTAAVVALPLALAFGNAALGPGGAIYGLYGAIVTGFLAALLGCAGAERAPAGDRPLRLHTSAEDERWVLQRRDRLGVRPLAVVCARPPHLADRVGGVG